MNQKEVTETFRMISNLLNPPGLYDLYKMNSALQGWPDNQT